MNLGQIKQRETAAAIIPQISKTVMCKQVSVVPQDIQDESVPVGKHGKISYRTYQQQVTNNGETTDYMQRPD
jgi:hypothetical protein